MEWLIVIGYILFMVGWWLIASPRNGAHTYTEEEYIRQNEELSQHTRGKP